MRVGNPVLVRSGYLVCPILEEDPENTSFPKIIGYVITDEEGSILFSGSWDEVMEELRRLEVDENEEPGLSPTP